MSKQSKLSKVLEKFYFVILSTVVTAIPALHPLTAHADIGGKRAIVRMPYVSGGQLSSDGFSHPPTSGNGFAADLRGGASVPVYARITSPDGNLTMRVTGITQYNAGNYVNIEVKVDGILVGNISYGHVVNLNPALDPTRYVNPSITADTQIGTSASSQAYGSCVGFRCSSNWQVSNTGGIHLHTDLKKACYNSALGPLSRVDATTPIAVMSESYPDKNNSTCSSSEMNTVGGTTSTSNNLASTTTLRGNWAGDSREEFAYISKRSDGGFALAVQRSESNGFFWQNSNWDMPGTTGVKFDNTQFIPTDIDNDGLTDILYATSSNWNANGFAVGMMHNNGTTFEYAGTQWAPDNLKLNETKFLPGNWAGDAREEFAYVTKRSDGGFAVARFEYRPEGIYWAGMLWDNPGSNGVTFDNTVFTPADTDNDGLTDLLYTTSSNWNNNGFAMGLQHNNGTGLIYGGTQWAPTNIKLSETRIIPGNWAGDGREDFAYVTKRSDGGFAVAIQKSEASGFHWQNVWWDHPGSTGVTYDNTRFIPADTDNDGLTDLLYATASNPNNLGFSIGLNHNTGNAFYWAGTAWSPTNLRLSEVRLFPQH